MSTETETEEQYLASHNFQTCKTAKGTTTWHEMYCNEVWDWLRVSENVEGMATSVDDDSGWLDCVFSLKTRTFVQCIAEVCTFLRLIP